MAVATARTASPSTSPVEASTPEGTSQATTGAVLGVDRRDRGGERLARRAAEAGSEQGVDDGARAGEALGGEGLGSRPGQALEVGERVAAQLAEVARRQHVDLVAVLAQQARHDQPVAAVVALADDDPDRPRPPAVAAVTRARPSPARSIRSSEGTPRCSIAQASTARISAAS